MSQPEEQKSDEASAEGPASVQVPGSSQPSAPAPAEMSDPAMAAPLPAAVAEAAQSDPPEATTEPAAVPKPVPADVLENASPEIPEDIPEVEPDAVMELDDPTNSMPMDDFSREATDEHISGFEEDPPTQPGVISQFQLASGDPAASGEIFSPVVADEPEPETAEGQVSGTETTDEKSAEPVPPKVVVDATLALGNDPPLTAPPMPTYDDDPESPASIPRRQAREANPEAEPEVAGKVGQATGAAAWFDDSFDDGYTMEGEPLFDDDTGDGTHEAPLVGQELATPEGVKVILEDSLGEASGRIFFRARVGEEGAPFTAVWIPHRLPEIPA
jgi:hypothetical protein